MRDIELGTTFDVKFTTTEPDTGAPATLSGTPAVSAYVGNSTTEITAGITLTVDFDGVTGLNNVRVVATSGNGFADNTDVALVITTGTVDGNSAVGYVIEQFTIGRSGAYRRLGAPAGASVSADIAAIEAQTDDIGAAGAGLTAIPWNAAWDAEVQSEVADALTAYDPPTNAELVSEINAVQADIAALNDLDAAGVRSAVGLASANLDTQLGDLPTAAENAAAVWGAGTRTLTALDEDSTTLDIDAAVRAAVGLASANLDTQLGTIDTNVDAIKAKTDSLTFTVAGQVDANIQYVNDTEVAGDGQTGTEWGPA